MPPVPQTPQALNLNTTSSLTLLALVLLLLALPSSLYLLARYDVINSRISRSTSPPITFSRLSFSTTHLITIQFNVRPAPLPSTNPYDHTSIFENPEWHLYPFRQVSPNVTIYQ